MTRWVPWLLLVLLVGGWFWQERRHAEQRREVAGLTAEKDSLLRVIGGRGVVIDSLRLRLQATEQEADDAIEESRAGEQAATRTARGLRDSLRGALANESELLARFDSMTAAYEAALEEAHVQVRELERVRAAQSVVIVEQDAQLGDYAQAVDRLEELAGYWQREAQPPFLIGLWRDAPKLLVAGAVGATAAVMLTR